MTFALPGLKQSMSSVEEEVVKQIEEHGRPVLSSRWRIFALILLVATIIAVGSPARAGADYGVTQCVPPAVPNTDAAPVPFGAYSIWARQHCGGLSFYGLRLDAGSDTGWTANGAGLAWRFTAPSGTSFVGANATVHYGNDSGFAAATFSNGAPPFSVLATCATPSSCWTSVAANSATIFEVRLQCFRTPNCHSNWAYAWTTNFTATVHDSSAPAIAANGPLLGGGVVRGVQTLHAAATDGGGGVRSVNIFVNGIHSKTADFCPPNYNGTYTGLKPCPDSRNVELAIDTQKDPGWTNGPNDVVICSNDAGGNVSSPCVRRSVHVDNSCPGSGGTTATDLDAGADIGGQLKVRAAVTSNVQPVIRGSLRDGSGSPVAGATVCVYETIELPDASRELISTATTQGNGRFATRLEPGPSRRLDLVYRFNDRVLSGMVQFDSRVVPTLEIPKKSLENGDAARFRGRLPGPNADGRAVAMQARVGRKWRTFKQLRTDADGRFRGKYRFTQTSGRVSYVFRALVKRQGGYPYEPGGSQKRKIVVRG
ncbi:MAG TPA: carboxypeptidase-like regulatory domain-containing protein [Solirubrobacterales bacterium]|nr:carboxypeptidase-like regulatory domain-containing protein [Solirubrobacterales bacterium]